MHGTRAILWSAPPTPFLHNGQLDELSLQRLVAQHLRLGIRHLFLGGTCGEGPFMTSDQAAELVAVMRRIGGADLHLAAQVSDMSAARVAVNIRRMQDAGADSVILAAPWNMRFANASFLRHYFLESLAVAKVPAGLYVQTFADTCALDLALWQEVMLHPNVKMVKDSSCSDDYRQAFAELRRQRPELLLLTGNEFDVVRALEAGYDGALLGTGILVGGMIQRAAEALAGGNRSLAMSWQQRSNRFLSDLFGDDCEHWLGGLKNALVELSVFSTDFRHLHDALDEGGRSRLTGALEREMALIVPTDQSQYAWRCER